MNRKMRDSGVAWIGDVPEGWGVSRLKYYITLYNGNSIPDARKSEYEDPDKAVPYISSKDIDVAYQTINYENGMYTKVDDTSFRVAPANSTLVCIEGGSAGRKKAYLTRTVSFVNKLCCFVAGRLIDNRYLFYALSGPSFAEEFRLNLSGMIGGVSINELRNFQCIIPPLPEQRAIAGYLDGACGKIDGLREKVEKQIAALEEYKKSVITEAVTGKVEVKGEGVGVGDGATFEARERDSKAMKPSGVAWIGDVPEGWGVTKFRFEFEFSKGLNITKADLVDDGVPVISYGQIHSKENSSVILKQNLLRYVTSETAHNDEAAKLQFGDIVFADTSEDYEGTGNCVRVHDDSEVFAGYHALVARPNSPAHSHYLIYLFQTPSWRSQLRRNVNGIKVFSITQKIFKDVSILLPPLPEQRAIAGYLDRKCAAIDGAVAKCKKQLDNLAEYKKSLIYECVTGKREVAA